MKANITQEKSMVRRSIAERIARLSASERAAESRSIVRRIKEQLPSDVRVVCAYHPMHTEPDLLPLLEELLARHASLYLPRTEGKAFTFRRMTDRSQLERGPFGILEPHAEAEELDMRTVQIALVPGVAFDAAGNRIGRGNGGYDRWITALRNVHPAARIWGIAFDCQMVRAIPTEAHDARVDAVVTPRRMTKPQ